MKIKVFLYLVLLSISLLLLGCGSNDSGSGISQLNYQRGYDGLTMNLVANAPPEQIYPNSDFMFMIEVSNRAAYDIIDGTVRIIGLDEKYFYVYPTEETFYDLLGRSVVNPEGDKNIVEFDGTSGELFTGAEDYRASYFLKANYRSTMEFSDTVCINPDLYNVYNAGCPEENKRYSGQGAPLAITDLEQVVSPNTGIEFRLTLENKGQGSVGEVTLAKSRLGSETLNCEFLNVAGADKKRIIFDNEENEAKIVCRQFFLNEQNAYTTVLLLTFSYDYELVQQEQLTLVR